LHLVVLPRAGPRARPTVTAAAGQPGGALAPPRRCAGPASALWRASPRVELAGAPAWGLARPSPGVELAPAGRRRMCFSAAVFRGPQPTRVGPADLGPAAGRGGRERCRRRLSRRRGNG